LARVRKNLLFLKKKKQKDFWHAGLGRLVAANPAPNLQKSFASFLQKRRVFLCLALLRLCHQNFKFYPATPDMPVFDH